MQTIKEARLSKGWSQIKAASMLGVTALTFQLWERRVGKPTPANREKLVALFGEVAELQEELQKGE